MNPASALDACLVLPTTETLAAPLAKEAPAEESFDSLLNEASESPPPAVEGAEEPTDERAAAEMLAPLLCFAPPPQPIVITLVELSQAEPPIEMEMPIGSPVETKAEGFTDFEGEATDFAASAKEGIPLDPKVFEAVPPQELVEPPPEMPEAAPPVAMAGTPVAKQEKRVKNTEKTVEFAAAPEQKMPELGYSRRIVAPVQRVESALPLHENSRPEVNFAVEAATEVKPVKALDNVAIAETIRSDVAALRLRGASDASITLRPENGPELHIDLRIARDGSVQASARVEKGDSQNLSNHWPQLQQSLATLGIRMADLSNQPNPEQHHAQREQSSFADQQNDRRREQPPTNFEEQFANQFQPKAAAPVASARRWQATA